MQGRCIACPSNSSRLNRTTKPRDDAIFLRKRERNKTKDTRNTKQANTIQQHNFFALTMVITHNTRRLNVTAMMLWLIATLLLCCSSPTITTVEAYSVAPQTQHQRKSTAAATSTTLLNTMVNNSNEGKNNDVINSSTLISSRRSFMASMLIASATTLLTTNPLPAIAAPDCFKDCMKNCKEIAPKDPEYCTA